ncbi:Methyltransferase [Deinococcus saxicola]|uniref:DNA methyltransferase n=1 Tax=Deinococcus saxicola TaxID=249406 RepID=UPI0039EE6336
MNTVWWFSKSEWPKADVSQVLTEYSDRMKKLISDPAAYYTPAERPSGHNIGASFGKDNGGAIPPNLLQIPNSEAGGHYLNACRRVGVKSHPARFPAKLPEFFIRFLTQPDDLVLDIFGGSNTTGRVAQTEGRQWLTFEQSADYLGASAFRFTEKSATAGELNDVYTAILRGESLDLSHLNAPLLKFA